MTVVKFSSLFVCTSVVGDEVCFTSVLSLLLTVKGVFCVQSKKKSMLKLY